MLRYINQNYGEHRLIITGDITDDGHETQYENAKKLLSPFQGRMYFCPGNHDYGAAGNFYSWERAVRFDEYLSKPFKQGGTFTGDKTPVVNIVKNGNLRIMLIALNSNLETTTVSDFACGAIGEEQLGALNAILEGSDPSIVKIVFLHHHPFIHGYFMKLKDADQLMAMVSGRIDAMLFGHKHVQGLWNNKDGIPLVVASANTPEPDNYAWEIEINGHNGYGSPANQVRRIRIRDQATNGTLVANRQSTLRLPWEVKDPYL